MCPLKGSKNTSTVHSRPHLVAGVASPSMFAKLEKLRGAQLSGTRVSPVDVNINGQRWAVTR